ncbi:hypothetical protein J1N35_007629 [Gossypium stocksii]|uniref:Uncharacterized protein n=1 Tax=Gossypium stocksii TaxID=47602 RepID=A0A9D3W7M8_9ROSI|nr:hypothetical protein J1N35_007629 [Gossypium stocksii]
MGRFSKCPFVEAAWPITLMRIWHESVGRMTDPLFFFYDHCVLYPRHWNIIFHGTSSTHSLNRASTLLIEPTNLADSLVYATEPPTAEIPLEATHQNQPGAPLGSMPTNTPSGTVDELFPMVGSLEVKVVPLLTGCHPLAANQYRVLVGERGPSKP